MSAPLTESEGACPACGGSGGGPFGPAGSAWDDDSYRCPACKGLGVVAVVASAAAVVPAPGAVPGVLTPLAKGRHHGAPSAPAAPHAPAAAREDVALARTRPAKRARAAAAGLKKQ